MPPARLTPCIQKTTPNTQSRAPHPAHTQNTKSNTSDSFALISTHPHHIHCLRMDPCTLTFRSTQRHPGMHIHDHCTTYTNIRIHRHHGQQNRPVITLFRVQTFVHNDHHAAIPSSTRHANARTHKTACVLAQWMHNRAAIACNCLRKAHPCTCHCKCMHARADSMLTRTHSCMSLCVRLSHYPHNQSTSLVSA